MNQKINYLRESNKRARLRSGIHFTGLMKQMNLHWYHLIKLGCVPHLVIEPQRRVSIIIEGVHSPGILLSGKFKYLYSQFEKKRKGVMSLSSNQFYNLLMKTNNYWQPQIIEDIHETVCEGNFRYVYYVGMLHPDVEPELTYNNKILLLSFRDYIDLKAIRKFLR